MIARIKCAEGEREFNISDVINSSGRIERRIFNQDHLVKVNLYGSLARAAGRATWDLAVTSVREAILALHHLTKQRTTQLIATLHDRVRWRVMVNGVQIMGDDPNVADELMIERELETIDIYPEVQGAGGGFLQFIIGALLLVVGIVLMFVPGLGPIAFTIGLDLALAGVAALLGGLIQLFGSPNSTQKPKKTQNNPSYLFGGTVNVIDQGGAIPLAYGNVICGSTLIGASITTSSIRYIDASNIVSGSAGIQPVSPVFIPVTPPEITPAMQEYMNLTGMTVWPSSTEVLTPQIGALPDAPQFVTKHWDGSLGFIYSSDPLLGVEENLAFPQIIDDNIIVTNAPDPNLVNYVNPNAPVTA